MITGFYLKVLMQKLTVVKISNFTMHLHFIGIIIVTLRLGEVTCRAFTAEEGPFNLVIYNTSNCVKEQVWFHTNVTAYTSKGKSLLRGIVAVREELKNIKFRIQVHYMDQGMIKVFEIKNQNCHNTIVQLVLKTLRLRYNDQKCTMKPVISEFDNLNLDSIFHTVVQSLWYGSAQIRWEVSVPAAKVMCLNIHVQMVKAKNGGNKAQS